MSLSAASYAHVRFSGRREFLASQSIAALPLPQVRGPGGPAFSEAEREFVGLVFGTIGLDPNHYRVVPLRRRMRATLRALRASSAEEAARRVRADVNLANRALCSLLIGFTLPFRDEAVFAALRHMLPGILSAHQKLRVWSAGCSHGAELLSFALLLAERNALVGSTLRGSDMRPSAIVEARRYCSRFWDDVPESFGGIKQAVQRDQFVKQLRAVTWVVEDIFSTTPACKKWDIIFCRNLAIYLELPAGAMLWNTLMTSLRPGGLLITGKAERPFPGASWRKLSPCIYQRMNE